MVPAFSAVLSISRVNPGISTRLVMSRGFPNHTEPKKLQKQHRYQTKELLQFKNSPASTMVEGGVIVWQLGGALRL